MNRLVIIGNGFDLAHDMKTSYKSFIEWYFKQFFVDFFNKKDKITKSDDLFEIKLKCNELRKDILSSLEKTYYFFLEKKHNCSKEFIESEDVKPFLTYKYSELLLRIVQDINGKGWTDIESTYYRLLIEEKNRFIEPRVSTRPQASTSKCLKLNQQMDFLREKLAEYLKEQSLKQDVSPFLVKEISTDIRGAEFAVSSYTEIEVQEGNGTKIEDIGAAHLENVMLLNFNYTNTIESYVPKINKGFRTDLSDCITNYIHGFS